MKKSIVSVLGTLGIALALVFMAAGCATFTSGGPVEEAGSLTISGFPSEYEGKTVQPPAGLNTGWNVKISTFKSASIYGSTAEPASAPDNDISMGTGAGLTGAVIQDGKVVFGVYSKKSATMGFGKYGYEPFKGSGSVSNSWLIIDDAEPGICFPKTEFADGKAEVNWADALKGGSLTISSIPGKYEGKHAKIRIGYVKSGGVGTALAGAALGALFGGDTDAAGASEKDVDGYVRNGTVTAKFTDGSVTEPYAITGPKDILLSLDTGETKQGLLGTSNPIYDDFLVEGVQFTDGKAAMQANIRQ